jgi:site-specific DNA recombinase
MPMIAAIYARKSTDQSDRPDEEKSVTRQVAHATAFAERKGWTVDPTYVYTDDAISGAIFGERRPGLYRLLNALTPRPPFQGLVVMDQSRLGREQDEVPLVLRRLTQAGVRIFCYLTDTEIKRSTAVEKFQTSAIAFVDEMAREQGRQRTKDAMVRKARHGHVAGGVVYGYRNVRHGDHVERVIDPDQAAVIRRIFEACAVGKGFVRSARALNGDGIPGPRGRSWAPTAIREMLYRDLYAGRIVYGKTTWTYQNGRRVKVDTPPSEWITVNAPALRIIDDALWTAAHERLHQTRTAYLRLAGGTLWGRPETGLESKYLLTGLAACGVCGASLHVRVRGPGNGRADYRCGYHYARGATVCPNARTVPMADANTAVLATLQRDVLTPEAVARVVTAALDIVRDRPDIHAQDRTAVQAELDRVTAELQRLTDALAAGQEFTSVQDAIAARESRRTALRARLAHLDGLQHVATLDPETLAASVQARLTDWQGLLERHPAQARQILRKLLVGRLVFTPRTDASGAYYEFTGEASYGKLLAGVAGSKEWCPRGESNTRPRV